jgi:indolepyruvate ferredoxin oxidoreductase alpha subunit
MTNPKTPPASAAGATEGAENTRVLLGDEAVARGAVDAGISVAYAYPGTPSTEIVEHLLEIRARAGCPAAAWCANEKTAYEEALGAAIVGRRSLVAMKHVGLNVAADPFMNSALLDIRGGLVVAVADDPGMHSSQNEQDSRYYADFARIPCLEPADQQQAYEMTREAFDLSERFQMPVLIRLVTRLAHSRAVVHLAPPVDEPPIVKAKDPSGWILLPSNARKRWRSLLDRQPDLHGWSESAAWNRLELAPQKGELGVITTGIARNYFFESRPDLAEPVSHLHIGAWPAPIVKIRALADRVRAILVLEDGYPFLERQLRGLLPPAVEIRGRESGHLRTDGELDPDNVRKALGLPARVSGIAIETGLAGRPPQLCAGCSHDDSFRALEAALGDRNGALVTSDIGCYTLGALPPHGIIESCVSMGASVGMAKGASEAGFRPVVAVIGDSTFLHSGITPLVDAVAAGTDMTLLILDNEAVAMTGAQPTMLSGGRLEKIVTGIGIAPEHCRVIEAHPKKIDEMTRVLREEIDFRGPSVVISRRECLEAARRRKAEGR